MNTTNPDLRKRTGPFWAKSSIAIVLFVMGGAAFYWWAFLMREHSHWTETIQLWDGGSLKIYQHSSQKAYHGAVGHFSPFWWGGGDPWGDVKFTVGGEKYRWDGAYIPIAIQPDNTGVYIAVFDRETKDYYHPTRFRLYRSTTPTTWEEIGSKDFPRHLAIQNTWLSRDHAIGEGANPMPNDYEIVAMMDTAYSWFQRSLTAKLWSYLENPQFDMERDVPEAFLRQYKAKWITGSTSSKPRQMPTDPSVVAPDAAKSDAQ
jgi:hypothetical protein